MQRNFYQPLSLSPEKQREEERQRAKLLKKYPKLAREMVRADFIIIIVAAAAAPLTLNNCSGCSAALSSREPEYLLTSVRFIGARVLQERDRLNRSPTRQLDYIGPEQGPQLLGRCTSGPDLPYEPLEVSDRSPSPR
jgi:hypothetical protein|eukprot:COSAG06_NODE_5044_length_3755_cov_3.084834_1_plen_137_part_00